MSAEYAGMAFDMRYPSCGDSWPDFRSQPWCHQPYGHLGNHDRAPWDKAAKHNDFD